MWATGVAVLGRLGPGHLGRQRGGEAGHLTAAVVDVVLALDVMADRREEAGDGIPVGGVAAAADVERPGRVGGDELDEDPLRRRGRDRPQALAGLAEARQGAPVPGVGEEEIDESGAGNLDPVDAAAGGEIALELRADASCDVAGRFPQRRGEQHRRVGAVVPQLGLRRAVEGGLLTGRLALAKGARCLVHCRAELCDRVGHGHHHDRMSQSRRRVRWPPCASR